MGVSLELAISAIRSGRKEEGRQLLNLLIQQDPNSDKAWLWMSSVVNTDEQRARCLYHVLAINPDSDLARRGLQVLGIVVSDSRPVKVPRDSQPIQIPKPSTDAERASSETRPEAEAASTERRPFLIDPQTITKDLPFTPLKSPVAEPVQASPSVLSIDVEAVAQTKPDLAQQKSQKASTAAQHNMTSSSNKQFSENSPSKPAVDPTKTQKMGSKFEAVSVLPRHRAAARVGQAATQNDEAADTVKPDAMPSPTETQRMVANVPTESSQHLQAKPVGSENSSENKAQQAVPPEPQDPYKGPQQAQTTSQPSPNDEMFPNGVHETRPSQPVPVSYPHTDMGMAQNGQMPYYPALPPPPDVTMGMSPNQYMQPQQMASSMYSGHGNITMGMQMPHQNGQGVPPSEPVPAIHSNSTMGMPAYGQGQFPPMPQNLAFHSSATMMMPTMTEAEARARLNSGQALPTANAAAMAFQNGSNGFGMAGLAVFQEDEIEDDDEEEGNELNILAIIIFGTLSVTALGGFGMIILLMLTSPV